MKRIYLLVEGQTEEAFIQELLTPAFASAQIYLTPILAQTSPGYKGGLVSYAKIKPQIEKLCKQDSKAWVSTMFDLYALPNDFPGKTSSHYPQQGSGLAKALFLEQALTGDIGINNFIPYLQVHEFEALLFADLAAFDAWEDADCDFSLLHLAREKYAPEDINDGVQTSPSKRILAAMPRYRKTLHGPLLAMETGLPALRTSCPHFNDWLKKLENLK